MIDLEGDVKVSVIESSSDPIVLLQELRLIAPDVWESNKRYLILPQTLGDFNKLEYVEEIQNMLCKLNEYIGMLNAELISEEEYESKKAEILSSMRSS